MARGGRVGYGVLSHDRGGPDGLHVPYRTPSFGVNQGFVSNLTSTAMRGVSTFRSSRPAAQRNFNLLSVPAAGVRLVSSA